MRRNATDRRRMATRWRAALVASLAVIAAGLSVVGAVAYACSAGVTEQTFVTPTSGKKNASLTVQSYTGGGGLYANAGGFYFRYAYPGDALACPQEAAIGAAVTSTSSGDIGSSSSKYSRTITNLGSVTGTGEACWSVTGSTDPKDIAAPAAITVN